MNISKLSQPSLKGSRVPPGHILVHTKFQDGPVIRLIQEAGITPIIQDGLGVVDFYPSNTIGVVWISEGTIVGSSEPVMKELKKLDEGNCYGMAIVEVSEANKQYYQQLQSSVLTDHNIPLVPVRSMKEMVKVVTQLVYSQSHASPVGKCNQNNLSMDDCLVATLKAFPAVGEKRAIELLKRFSSIQQIEQASLQELGEVAGRATALQIKQFLEGKKPR